MDKFKIGSFWYAPFNNHNKEHLLFLKDILQEIEEEGELEKRMGDISYMFDHSYQELETFSIENKNPYLICEEDKIIGFIYMYPNQEKELLLYLAIHKNFRNKGYSTKINKELTDYLLNQFDIKRIKVQVEKDNIGSLKAIKKCGFVPIENDFYIKER